VHRVATEDGAAALAVDPQPHLACGVPGQRNENQPPGQLVTVIDQVDQAGLHDRQDAVLQAATCMAGAVPASRRASQSASSARPTR
jgi:hypothetical protein